MSILDKKQKIFGKIAAARTLVEDMPKLKLNSSFPSINNKGNVITFLTDLIKSLEGYEELVNTVIETISKYSDIIEKEIKNALKLELKEIVSCGINPSLPDYIKSTGNGIKVLVSKIDFLDLMKTDPNSDAGKLIYTDIPANLIDSKDFNVFLYQVIQNNGTTESWGHQTGGQDILTFSFKDIDISGIDPNNTLTIKAHPNYDNKSLSDLNNNFIDSLTLFDTAKILTNIINTIFGTISNTINKGINQLSKEIKINHIIDKISNSDGKDILSDKFFLFSNEEKNLIEQQSRLLNQGVSLVDTAHQYASSISFNSLQNSNNLITSATTAVQKTQEVTKSINDFSNQVANQSNDINKIIKNRETGIKTGINTTINKINSFQLNKIDHKAIKLDFIQKIINSLIKAITNSVLSPKTVTIFIINFKIIYGPNEDYGDAVDFLKKNKNLIHNITKRISGIIIKILLKKAMKRIAMLIAETQLKKQLDKNQANITQLLSLTGVPPDVLRQIKGLL